MREFRLVVLFAVMAMMVSACAGTVYHQKVDLGGGDTADVVGRTGVFGTDLTAVRFKNKASNDPDILRLQSYESLQSTQQTYNQRCPDPRQLKNIKTTTVNQQRTAYQDVPNPNKRQDQIAVIGGTNPSTGNVLLPAAVQAAGMAGGMVGAAAVLRPARVNVNQTGGGGGGAAAAGGSGGAGGAGGTNTNTNTNTNTATGTGTGTASSSSSSN